MRIDSLISTSVKSDVTESAVNASTRLPAIDVHEKPVVAEPRAAVAAAARQIEAYLERAGRSLEFRVDAETNRTIVTVRDATSGEVIRQIPGDEVLHLARQLAAGSGGLVNLKV